jgi:hypothetical protein
MSASNAKDSSFIGYNCSAELRNFEVDFQGNFLLRRLLDIIKVDEFRSPFEVVDLLFRRAIALLQDEYVLQQV